ncbi:hypothetical protein V493_07393 [Pseudogymnoascus sp. VKM F-4281 (FW-2241)]|nr:hypothetical protein V493_07393 [Pseudogymnoascus sp. VKM F-4281 (FW-2241)]
MKSIPSLVASSTVGVAVTGLAFGQPQTPGTSRPSSNKRKATEYDAQHRSYSSPPVRPATSSVINTPRRGQLSASSPIQPSSYPSHRYINNTFTANDSPIHNTRRIGSLSRLGERTSTPEQGSEDRLDSISSKGSWMRRLSVIPNSQNGSPRSSIGPDSPSLFSHGSAGPILHNGSSPSQLQPNKLVKRSTSIRGSSGNTPSRPSSNQRIPTLRRPATSHQRSVTLQQQYRDDESGHEPSPLQEEFPVTLIHEFAPTPRRVSWRPYFTSRRTRLAKERPSTAINDNNADGLYSTFKRVLTPDESALPTLMKPSLIEDPTKANKIRNRDSIMSIESVTGSPHPGDDPGIHASDYETHKRPRQSISLNFGSPATWITKSNSVRLTKNRDLGRGAAKRNISAPLSSVPDRATSSQGPPSHGTFDPSLYQQKIEASPKNFQGSLPRPRTRNTSSPLPTISRLSSFNLDLNGPDPSPNSNVRLRTPTSPASSDGVRTTSRPSSSGRFKGLSSHPVVLHQQHPPRLPELNTSDRASTLVGSDSDARAFASGEDDETDFQSDTAYDSLRTGATASLRARSTPLDSMFDESPPSSGAKSRATDFNDMGAMSGFRNVDDSIVEEDEGMSTPIRSRRRLNGDIYSTPIRQDNDMDIDPVVRSSPPSFCLATTEFGRMSLGDDDDDEDWTRDDDSIALSNPLSPPSNSLNSLRVSHALRSALMDVTESGSSMRNGRQPESRPRSVFDWSEPLMQEKVDNMGNSPRPKTVHGKQGNDRGGRAVGRNRPSALHIRSQSVPVVPDVGGNRDTKLAPKFGTWGLGGKGVSEDWDNDFEFDGMDIDEGDDLPTIGSGAPMLVPPAIRASQANVVGHVGQIREVCLLVEDLKRLRGLAREKGLLEGPSADKWREAEGIIALAIPDEEDETLSPPQSPLAAVVSRDGGHQNHDTTVHIDSIRDSGFQDEEDEKPIPSPRVYGNTRPRRKSVFSPEDDIFGSSLPRASFEEAQTPRTAPRRQASKDTSDVARSVMQNIHQHRASSDPIYSSTPNGTLSKMPFDTTSLKDLVQRANALARALSEVIRKADGTTQSPYRSPHLNHDSSPAFTRVFTDPLASPNINRSQSNNAVLNTTIDSSPTRNLGQRMQMMTVV